MNTLYPYLCPFSIDLSSGEGRANVTVANVGVGDGGIGGLRLNIGRNARVGSARTTLDTRLGRVTVDRVGRVEPESVGRMVIPDAHDEDHAALERLAHASNTTLGLEVVLVTEERLLSITEVVRDGVELGEGVEIGVRVLNDLSILDVLAADLDKITTGSVVGGN